MKEDTSPHRAQTENTSESNTTQSSYTPEKRSSCEKQPISRDIYKPKEEIREIPEIGELPELPEEQRYKFPKSRKKYMPETKIEACRYARTYKAKEAGAKFGIPPYTIKHWLSLYNKFGNSAFLAEGEIISIKEGPMTPIYNPKPQNPQNPGEFVEGSVVEVASDEEGEGGQDGWKNLNLVSPSFRLWSAKEGARKGVTLTANSIGVPDSTVRRWVSAYRAKGEEAHIFKANVKRYKGPRTLRNTFSYEFKQEMVSRAGNGESSSKVAYENGISPDTITKWKRTMSLENSVDEGSYRGRIESIKPNNEEPICIE